MRYSDCLKGVTAAALKALRALMALRPLREPLREIKARNFSAKFSLHLIKIIANFAV